MPIPSNKSELQSAIKDTYAKLKKDLDDIPIELTNIKELAGHAKGTLMSVSDLVAYLIGWGELVLKWNDLIQKGEEVDFPETGFKWTELGLLAQKFYKDYEKYTYKKRLILLDNTVAKLLHLIESTSDDDLYKTLWYKTYPMGRMIQLNSSSPYKNARARVRKWKKTKNI